MLGDMKGKIAAGKHSTIGVTATGTVVATAIGKQRTYDEAVWHDINSVSVGSSFTVGLKNNGRVVSTDDGYNVHGASTVSNWSDIVGIVAGNYTFGLKSDGTAVTTIDPSKGWFKDSSWSGVEIQKFRKWDNLISITAGLSHVAGLRKDGKVIAAGDNKYCSCNTAGWSDIVSVVAGYYCTVGLKSDGTVVYCGALVSEFSTLGTSTSYKLSEGGNYTIPDWNNIVSVAVGAAHIIGLKKDGSVVAFGANSCGECNVAQWQNIVAIAAGERHSVGLKADGTVVAVGDDSKGQCNVSEWLDIGVSSEKMMSPEEWQQIKLKEQAKIEEQKIQAIHEQELLKAKENEAEDVAKRMEILNKHQDWRKKHLCGFCGGKIAMFSGKCKSCEKPIVDWAKFGETELIKELDLGTAILEQHRSWHKKGLCGVCGSEVTLLTEKCKKCEKKRSAWKQHEKEIMEKYNIHVD